MRGEQETAAAIDRHADMVRRLCLIHLKNQADSEDVFQTVFMKYVLSSAVFENEEHEKAWFIRVTINACRDLLRSFFRSRTVPLDELIDLPADAPSESREVLEAASLAKRGGAFLIAITRYGRVALAGIADVHFGLSAPEMAIRSGAMSSRIAQMTMIDILFSCMVSRHYKETVPHLERTRQVVHAVR